MANALEINNLKKIYGSGVEALRGIDLSVKEGRFLCAIRAKWSWKVYNDRDHYFF